MKVADAGEQYERLPVHFDLLSTSANGATRLRELILSLAVRGRLSRHTNTHSQGERESKGAVSNASPVTSDEARPCVLPASWEWRKFSDVLDFQGGSQPPKNKFSERKLPGYTRLIQIRDLGDKPQPIYVNKDDVSKFCKEGDVMVGRYGASVGKVFWGIEGAYNVALIKMIDEHSLFDNRFLYLLLRSDIGQSWFKGISRSAQDGFNKGDLANRWAPLPPRLEQVNIVARVEDLMKLCDALEENGRLEAEQHARLVSTLFDTLAASESPQALTENWQRIAQHFDLLLDRPEAVDALEQTILQIAMRGLLVPQDDNEGSAQELLERLVLERQSKKKLETDFVSKPIAASEKPFSLPASWCWVRLGDVVSIKHGFAFGSASFTDQATGFVVTTPGNFYEKGGFRDRGSKTKFYRGSVEPEFILSPGDLIIPMTEQAPGLLGSPAFIPDDGKSYLHNQRLGKIVFFSNTIAPEFMYCFFNSAYFRSELARTCTGMKVRHTSPKRVLGVPIPICSVAEQHRIAARVKELHELCTHLRERLTLKSNTQARLAEAIVNGAVSQAPN